MLRRPRLFWNLCLLTSTMPASQWRIQTSHGCAQRCRPGQKSRARYYAVVTLNQMVLSHNPKHGGSPLACKLIDIYFSLFRLTLDRKIGVAAERTEHAVERAAAAPASRGSRRGSRGRGRGRGAEEKGERKGEAAEEVDARMLGALIVGVRRAFPYVDSGALDSVFETHATQLFRTVHRAPFNVATQALMLLFQVRPCSRMQPVLSKGHLPAADPGNQQACQLQHKDVISAC